MKSINECTIKDSITLVRVALARIYSYNSPPSSLAPSLFCKDMYISYIYIYIIYADSNAAAMKLLLPPSQSMEESANIPITPRGPLSESKGQRYELVHWSRFGIKCSLNMSIFSQLPTFLLIPNRRISFTDCP